MKKVIRFAVVTFVALFWLCIDVNKVDTKRADT